jgi:hypothetical protein
MQSQASAVCGRSLAIGSSKTTRRQVGGQQAVQSGCRGSCARPIIKAQTSPEP